MRSKSPPSSAMLTSYKTKSANAGVRQFASAGSPLIRLVSECERRQLAYTELAGAWVDDPVEAADVRVVDAVAIQVTSGSSPCRALFAGGVPRSALSPTRNHRKDRARCASIGILRWDVLQELIVLVDDLHVDPVAVSRRTPTEARYRTSQCRCSRLRRDCRAVANSSPWLITPSIECGGTRPARCGSASR